jgi:hypothetical protein
MKGCQPSNLTPKDSTTTQTDKVYKTAQEEIFILSKMR